MAERIRVPLYRKIEEDLFDRIFSGEFRSGDALPTEDVLMREYGVSRITVRRSLSELMRRELIVRRQGVGTFVRDVRTTVRSVRLRAALDDVLPFNRHEVLERGTAVPDPKIAEMLQIAPGGEVDRVEAINIFDGTRFAYVVFDFPRRFGALIHNRDFEGRVPPVQLLQRRSGLKLRRGRQVISAAVAEDRIASLLDITPGVPLLKLTRVYLADHDIPIEALTLYYHPDRYEMVVELTPMGMYDEPLATPAGSEASSKNSTA